MERTHIVGEINCLCDYGGLRKAGFDTMTYDTAGQSSGPRPLHMGVPRDATPAMEDRKPHVHGVLAVAPETFKFTRADRFTFSAEPAQALTVWICHALSSGFCDFGINSQTQDGTNNNDNESVSVVLSFLGFSSFQH